MPSVTTILCSVVGQRRREFLTTIQKSFADIHDSYKRIEVVPQFPCLCEKCSSSPKPYYFAASILYQALAEGQEKIQCYSSFKVVSIDELLGDFMAVYRDRDRFGQLLAQIGLGDLENNADILRTVQGLGRGGWF